MKASTSTNSHNFNLCRVHVVLEIVSVNTFDLNCFQTSFEREDISFLFPSELSLNLLTDSCDSAAVTDGLRCYYVRTTEGKGRDLRSFHFPLTFASSLAESTASHMVMLWQLFGFLRHKVSLKNFSNGPQGHERCVWIFFSLFDMADIGSFLPVYRNSLRLKRFLCVLPSDNLRPYSPCFSFTRI